MRSKPQVQKLAQVNVHAHQKNILADHIFEDDNKRTASAIIMAYLKDTLKSIT